jgi:drug/metabolite transporter (DMT)-like permease
VFSRRVQTLATMSHTHLKTALALVLALASTTFVSLAYLREHAAVGGLPELSLRRPVRSVRLLIASRAWLAGFAMETTGFVMYVAALALAPLALVQSVAAGGIGILAVASARVSRRSLTPRESLGAGVSVAGLLFLSLSLIGGADHSSHGSLVQIGLWLGGTCAAAALVLTVGRAFFGAAAASGIAGGLLFSCGDIATKVATQGGGRVAFALAAIFGYVLGTSLLQIGYQRGAALTIAGIATLLTNALPIAAGPVLLNENLPTGGLGALRIAAFATVIAGAVLLARPQGAVAGAAEGAQRPQERGAQGPLSGGG